MASSNCYSGRDINQLNDDILSRIFDYLHFDDKIRLRRTCFRWKILLDLQLAKSRALRIGLFQQSGYSVTSGLYLQCAEHNNPNQYHPMGSNRANMHVSKRHTGTLFNERILKLPADMETQCYSIHRYDYLHRALKYCYKSITILSLGRLNISYRLLIVLTHNLPNLEHLELIACASKLTESYLSDAHPHRQHNHQHPSNNQAHARRPPEVYEQPIINSSDTNRDLPSLESFNNSYQRQAIVDAIYSSTILFNQVQDEQTNMEHRLLRSSLVKNCQLVQEAKQHRHWPNLKHLLVKDCNLFNEFSLCLLIEMTSHTLTHLSIESSQYITGEFLNYCNPKLEILNLKYCPSMQNKFLQDFIKLKQLLSPIERTHQQQPTLRDSWNNFKIDYQAITFSTA